MDWTLQDFLGGFEKEISVRETYVPLETANVGDEGIGQLLLGAEKDLERQIPY